MPTARIMKMWNEWPFRILDLTDCGSGQRRTFIVLNQEAWLNLKKTINSILNTIPEILRAAVVNILTSSFKKKVLKMRERMWIFEVSGIKLY
jgi:hypothetical protein